MAHEKGVNLLPAITYPVSTLATLAGGAAKKKQALVALSTSEAEFVTLSTAAQEAAWLQKVFTNLQMSTKAIEDN